MSGEHIDLVSIPSKKMSIFGGVLVILSGKTNQKNLSIKIKETFCELGGLVHKAKGDKVHSLNKTTDQKTQLGQEITFKRQGLGIFSST